MVATHSNVFCPWWTYRCLAQPAAIRSRKQPQVFLCGTPLIVMATNYLYQHLDFFVSGPQRLPHVEMSKTPISTPRALTSFTPNLQRIEHELQASAFPAKGFWSTLHSIRRAQILILNVFIELARRPALCNSKNKGGEALNISDCSGLNINLLVIPTCLLARLPIRIKRLAIDWCPSLTMGSTIKQLQSLK